MRAIYDRAGTGDLYITRFLEADDHVRYDADPDTRAEARASLFGDIEVFYDRVRRHSSLGNKAPVEYERAG